MFVLTLSDQRHRVPCKSPANCLRQNYKASDSHNWERQFQLVRERPFIRCKSLNVKENQSVHRKYPASLPAIAGRCPVHKRRLPAVRRKSGELVHISTKPDCRDTDAYPFSEPPFLLLMCPLLDCEADRARTGHLMRRRRGCGTRPTAAAPAAADTEGCGSHQNQPQTGRKPDAPRSQFPPHEPKRQQKNWQQNKSRGRAGDRFRKDHDDLIHPFGRGRGGGDRHRICG